VFIVGVCSTPEKEAPVKIAYVAEAKVATILFAPEAGLTKYQTEDL
jgi:hypothetical protein